MKAKSSVTPHNCVNLPSLNNTPANQVHKDVLLTSACSHDTLIVGSLWRHWSSTVAFVKRRYKQWRTVSKNLATRGGRSIDVIVASFSFHAENDLRTNQDQHVGFLSAHSEVHSGLHERESEATSERFSRWTGFVIYLWRIQKAGCDFSPFLHIHLKFRQKNDVATHLRSFSLPLNWWRKSHWSSPSKQHDGIEIFSSIIQITDVFPQWLRSHPTNSHSSLCSKNVLHQSVVHFGEWLCTLRDYISGLTTVLARSLLFARMMIKTAQAFLPSCDVGVLRSDRRH